MYSLEPMKNILSCTPQCHHPNKNNDHVNHAQIKMIAYSHI